MSVVAVEDPVEHIVDGIRQIQVRPDQGMTFEKALRSALRQDPDLLVIGEIRDVETAEVAIRAALTGHIVITSLHTRGAVACIERLASFGISMHMLISSLSVVIYQELTPAPCIACRYFSPELGYLISKKGCAACKGGISGRRLDYELMICNLLAEKMSGTEVERRESIPRAVLNSCIVRSKQPQSKYLDSGESQQI